MLHSVTVVYASKRRMYRDVLIQCQTQYVYDPFVQQLQTEEKPHFTVPYLS
jgi:hypothetical protein